MVILDSAQTTIRVVVTTLEGLALLLTLLRVGFRLWIGRFWWEDGWAVVAFCCGMTTLVSVWVYLTTVGEISGIAYWTYTFAFTCVVWAVRISIILSITRIVYLTLHLRRITQGIAVFFALMWGGLVAQKGWQCGSDLTWFYVPSSTGGVACHLTRPMAIFELGTDCVADILLIASSIKGLRKVGLTPKQRRMMITIFSSSMIMTLVSIFHATTQLARIYTLTSIATDLEVAFCLIVCNLLVAVTFLYRTLGGRNSDQDDDFTTRLSSIPTPANQYLTTVDLTDATQSSWGNCGPSIGASFTVTDSIYPKV
ncbi:hypothetical protein HYDPIDRAFT_105770 [Hydnomerulius pinastri MD-312]|nr:hypothetical protein HYDPIDRAFT_105770 [Hydnomerulius pinastri MD-312]